MFLQQRILQLILYGGAFFIFAAFTTISKSAAADSEQLVWSSVVDWAGGTDAALQAVVHGKRLFVAGTATGVNGDLDFLVAAHNTKNGDLVWEHAFDLAGGNDEALGIAISGKRVIAVGYGTAENDRRDFLVRAFKQKTGELLWEDIYDQADENDHAQAVVATRNRVFVVGYSTNAEKNFDFVVRAYLAKDGTLLWMDTFNPENLTDKAYSLVIKGNTLYVTGWVNTVAGKQDYVVRAYKAR